MLIQSLQSSLTKTHDLVQWLKLALPCMTCYRGSGFSAGLCNTHLTVLLQWMVWWLKRGLAAVMGEIKSRFDSIAIWSATKIRFKHCAIRFKYHAIWYWFDSNFNDSIQETLDLNRNLEVMVEIEYSFSLLDHYSVRSYLQMQNGTVQLYEELLSLNSMQI